MQLETERLVLRRPEMADVDALARVYGDPEVMRYVGRGRTLTRRQTVQSTQRVLRHWDEDGFGLFSVVRKEDGRLLGRVGLLVWEREPWRPVSRAVARGPTELEVGYTLGREFWGHGYATEAARAVRDYALEALGANRLISLIRPENEASKGVARKLGMRYERDVEVEGAPAALFALTATRADDARAAPRSPGAGGGTPRPRP